MSNLDVLVVVLVVGAVIGFAFNRRRQSLAPKRGFGVAADLGSLADLPRVRVDSLRRLDVDRVRVVFAPEATPSQETPELDFVVMLGEGELGDELLREWLRDGSALAVVIPPGSRLVRVRSIDSLQHLTLRRADER